MKICIMTNLCDFNRGYSLTSIIADQCKMLHTYGHEVVLFVNDNFRDTYPVPPDVEIRKVMPNVALIDYNSEEELTEQHRKYVDEKLKPVLLEHLKEFQICLTHDLCFTGWNLLYALGLKETADQTRHCLFLHWIHSVPRSYQKDWWDIGKYGNNHKIVSPSKTNALLLSERFRGLLDDVVVIPHIKDLRTWFDFGEDTEAFIREHPGMMWDDVVMVYPASSDRMKSKQCHIHIMTAAACKRRCITCTLVFANQWATETINRQVREREDITKLKEICKEMNLTYSPEGGQHCDVIFTSDFEHPKYDHGIPKKMLCELMCCANLFMFPTIEEAWGLVGPEAALCGNYIVLNRDLDVLSEVFQDEGLYYGFGSSYRHLNIESGQELKYTDDIAASILHNMFKENLVKTRTITRQLYNYDRIYQRYYEPLITSWSFQQEQP
jgi:hypothetical protein